MTRTFRTASGRKIRVQVSEKEAWRIRGYRFTVFAVPVFWMAIRPMPVLKFARFAISPGLNS